MSSILALDIGEKRIGVALAEPPILLAHPLVTLEADALATELHKLITNLDVKKVVVGYPRNQAGDATAQSAYVEKTVSELRLSDSIQVVWQDESLTSVKAEEELEGRGKPFSKEDVDMLAATYILEDYLKEAR